MSWKWPFGMHGATPLDVETRIGYANESNIARGEPASLHEHEHVLQARNGDPLPTLREHLERNRPSVDGDVETLPCGIWKLPDLALGAVRPCEELIGRRAGRRPSCCAGQLLECSPTAELDGVVFVDRALHAQLEGVFVVGVAVREGERGYVPSVAAVTAEEATPRPRRRKSV